MDNFKCMLAKPFDIKRVQFPCLISPKLDGIRAQFYKGEFYTRNKKKVIGMDHLKEVLKPLASRDIHLDGELLVPGIPFQKSSGLIRSYTQTPDAVFHIFDFPYLDAPLFDRLRAMQLAVMGINSEHIKLVEHSTVSDYLEIVHYYQQYRNDGYEGAMVKSRTAKYTGTRSNAWLKMKEVETYDVECVGFFEGQGRLTGTLGGIIVELDGVRIRVGGGFSDEDRDHIWRCKDQYRNTVCEIAGQELTPDGSLRHPRFITWRPDK